MDSDVRRRRVALAGLAAWILLLPLAGGRALAQAAPPPASTDFEVVEVDLNGQLFNRVLPFDVPFIVTGAVPPGISSLEVRCWELRFDEGRRRPVLLTADDLKRAPDGDCWPAGPQGGALTWRNTIDPATPNPQFRVLVPPLQAERYYQFKFSSEKRVTAEEAAAFAQQVQGIVDATLWGDPQRAASLPLAGDLTPDELKALRDQMIQALRQATGADRVLEPGSVFNDRTPFDEVRREFNPLLLPVRSVQGQIGAAADNYNAEVQGTVLPLLQQLRTDPALGRLQDALAGRAAADAGVRCHADRLADLLAFQGPPPLVFQDRRSPAALSAFVQRGAAYFSTASANAADLRGFLAGGTAAADGCPSPLSLGALAAAAPLAPDDRTALAALAQPTGLVGSLDRALKGLGGVLLPNLQRALDRRSQAVAAVAETYRTRVENIIVVAGSTTGSFQTQSNNYISADAGVACAPQLSTCSTYLGTNIYFHPVNKAAPLDRFGPFFSRGSLARRVSVTLGLTVNGIADDSTREDLFGNQSLVAGLGARLTNSVRLTAGSLVFRKLSPNPLSTDKKLTTTYFLSISFDVDVVPTLKGIGGLFKP